MDAAQRFLCEIWDRQNMSAAIPRVALVHSSIHRDETILEEEAMEVGELGLASVVLWKDVVRTCKSFDQALS